MKKPASPNPVTEERKEEEKKQKAKVGADKAADESEEIDYERPDASIPEIIDEMKKRRLPPKEKTD